MPLEVSIDQIDGKTAVVSLNGSLTLGTNLKIADLRVQQLVSEGYTRMVLDLTNCPYCDSAGLGMLINLYGILQSKDGVLRLCGVDERICNVIRMTRTDGLLPCDANRDASLAAIA
jgi:anti-sigma B factor antagonist